MKRHNFIINGKEDVELRRAGMWFVLTYLYSKNIDPKETRHTLARNIGGRIAAIRRASQGQIKSWLEYALTKLSNDSSNSGNVSLLEQKNFATQLDKLAVLIV